MSRKRVQLSDLDRKKICELAVEHQSLSQDKLTAPLQTQLNKPELAGSTVTGILKECTKWLALSRQQAVKLDIEVRNGRILQESSR